MSDHPTPEDGVFWLTANRDALVEEVRQTNDALAEEIGQQIDSLAAGDSISVSDLFALQMQMNQLSQLSEISSSVVSSANSAIASMARNVKS